MAPPSLKKQQHSATTTATPPAPVELELTSRDPNFLRSIPEEQNSETASNRSTSAGGLQKYCKGASVASSVVAVDASSVSSDAKAVLGGGGGNNHRRGADDDAGSDMGTSILAETGADVRVSRPPREEIWTKRRLYWCAFWGLLAVVVLSAIVGVVVVNNNSAPTRDGGTRSPSAAPRDPVQAVEAIIEIVSDPELLNDKTTPQYAAKEWMLQTDQMKLVALEAGPERVAQRYALVAFYFSTGGPHWNTTGQAFLNPATSECDWPGVTCVIESRRRRALQEKADSVFRLFFQQMNMTGSIPTEIGVIPTIKEVDFVNNTLTGTIPSNLLDSWERLQWLDLSGNSLTGSIPPKVWSHPELKWMFLNENNLTGSVTREDAPDNMDQPRNQLKQVQFYRNEITGSLPTWLSELQNLEHWITFENNFTGPLPDPAEKLTWFDVSYNELSGTIPETMWSLHTSPPLQKLYLNHNQLRGVLPNATLARQDIEELWLNDNQLSGAIPEDFGIGWRKVVQLKVHHNKLTGMLGPGITPTKLEEECPIVWPLWTMEETSDFVLKSDCFERFVTSLPPVQCDCCTKCEAPKQD